MTAKTVLSLPAIILTLLAGCIAVFAADHQPASLTYVSQYPRLDASQSAGAAADPVAMVILPAVTHVSVGDTFTTTVQVETGTQLLDAGAAYIDFDPDYVQVVSLVPGTTLSLVLQNEYDNVAGKIDYAAGLLGSSTSGTFTLVDIVFQATAATAGSPLTFQLINPRMSDLTLHGTSILDNLEGGTLIVDGPTPTPTWTSLPTSTPTLTPSSTVTPTASRTATVTPSTTSTATPTASRTQTRTPSGTPTATATTSSTTPTPTATPWQPGQPIVLQQGLDGYQGCTDTHIFGWEPAVNYGDDGWLRIRSGGWRSALIRYDLSTLGTNPTIEQATLYLYIISRSNENNVTAHLHELLRAWTEDEATWEYARTGHLWGAAGATAAGIDLSAHALHSTPLTEIHRWMAWDVTGQVRSWVSNPASNFGIIIAGEGAGGVEYRFASSEYVWGDYLRPRLEIQLGQGSTATPTATATVTPTATATTSPAGDLVIDGLVYDAIIGPGAPVAAARIVATLGCQANSFEAYADLWGRYALLIPAAYANACSTLTLRATAGGYAPSSTEYTIVALRIDPTRDIGMMPGSSASTMWLPLFWR